MKEQELLHLIKGGETSFLQLKQDVRNTISIVREMIAFANSKGGKIIIGVNDNTGAITGLNFRDIQRINSLLSTAANEHIKNPIIIETTTETVENKRVIVCSVEEGFDKPYKDKDGLIFVKNGADKRKVVSNEELMRLLQSSGKIKAEETILQKTSIQKHLDKDRFADFFEARYQIAPEWDKLPQILENLHLAKEGKLSLAGALLFGLNTKYILPSFYISAVWYRGNDLSGTDYLSSENIYGILSSQYRQGFEFIYAKLEKRQNGQDFNSLGEPEIPKVVISELLINALVHRNYFIADSIKLLVFDNRIEIKSPGSLPNNLDETAIRLGISKRRNELLSMFAIDVLPYRALGSGIVRALKVYPHIEFENDKKAEEFRVIITRPDYVDT